MIAAPTLFVQPGACYSPEVCFGDAMSLLNRDNGGALRSVLGSHRVHAVVAVAALAVAACNGTASITDGSGDAAGAVDSVDGGTGAPDSSDDVRLRDTDTHADAVGTPDGAPDAVQPDAASSPDSTMSPDATVEPDAAEPDMRPGGCTPTSPNEILDNGVDDDCDPETPDSCTYVPDPANAAGEPAELAGVTALHNQWRARVGTAPLKWNTELAASAQAWADNCQFQHDSNRSPDAGFSSVGENIAWGGGSTSSFFGLWVNERSDYDFGTAIDNQNYQVFGHYTQVVWGGTTDLGCGIQQCSNGKFMVCRYAPAGNFLGRTPYGSGQNACFDLDNDEVLQMFDADDTNRGVQ